MGNQGDEARIDIVRRFNRLYTRQLGMLGESYLASPFSLTQIRILYEIAARDEPTASELAADLRLDEGYLSRLLLGLEQQALIVRRRAPTDGRQRLLSLTERGDATLAPLEEASRDQIRDMLEGLPSSGQARLREAMRAIEELLGNQPRQTTPYLLRLPGPGDYGWVVGRHGALYANEYGWDATFEGLVARIVADFVDGFDPARERCWIAERDGDNVGCVFLVRDRERPEVAKLRLLLVEPTARGLGIGRRLVEECSRFARQAGYQKISLWTNSVLVSAIRIYEQAGYRLVHEAPHRSFGHDLTEQVWELDL